MCAIATVSGIAQDLAPRADWEAFPGDGAKAVGVEGVHDPTILEVGGRYFCFHTSGNGFGSLRTSKDLKTWTDLGHVLAETPDWLKERIPNHRSLWAPDVIHFGKRLRMYYCASERFGGNGSVIGFCENDRFDPDGPHEGWVDHGLVIESVQGKDVFNAIDPEVLVDQEGRHWLFFGSYFAGLHVTELDPATGKLKHPDRSDLTCVARNTADRGNALEAPAVCYRDGYYYLFVSYGLAAQGVRSTYRIMVGRSKKPNGPFLDREGRSMVDGGNTNVLRGSPPMFAPGHSDVLRLSDGRWVMPYHFYDGREHWHGDVWGRPALQIRELWWDAEGWPLPALPLEATRPKETGMEGVWTHQADFGRVLTATFKKDGTFTDGSVTGHWDLKGEALTLKWPRTDEPNAFWEDRLIVRDGYYVGRNRAGMVIRGIKRTEGR
ncbi:MAG: arabinan endo-1,5-alpha-L-arabinosidase [Fimbriimonadaceae bacterium]|nr:arabinan endo-1,5-alpha-L-arabinosidase [Fimbriimonadaceae bacterium]